MPRILVLSNGHGEDVSGCILARRLISIGNKVEALPIVGLGEAYKKEKINIIGKTRKFNTGGLGYNSLKGRIYDLFNGQIYYFFKKIWIVFLIRKKYDYFLVVGDIVPIFFAWLSNKKFFTYLVAYSSHYEGKLNLPWPCNYFLKSPNSIRIYTRDHLTSIDLSNQLKKEVLFFGNPFIDKLLKNNIKDSNNSFHIALLPGSRINELINNFELMLDIIQELANYKFFKKTTFNFALSSDLKMENVQNLLEMRNWQFEKILSSNFKLLYSYKFIKVFFKWNSFDEILTESDFAISMSGTAAEQVVGMSKPVLQVEGKGPQFTKGFAEAQRRLLGQHVYCFTNFSNKHEQINGTIDLIIKIMYLMKLDNSFLKSCKENARDRLGNKNATVQITSDIAKYIISD